MYSVTIEKDRPDYRVFIDLLFGPGRNVDTDGDSYIVNSRTWTYLYISDRESDSPHLEICSNKNNSNIFEVQSESNQLETVAALYLFLYCGSEIKNGIHSLRDIDVNKLKGQYVSNIERAENAIWHSSSNENPYPNLAKNL